MERNGKKVNTDPVRAAKRATTDLRCAARKLGLSHACRVLLELAAEEAGIPADQIAPGNHSVISTIGRWRLAGLIIAGGAATADQLDLDCEASTELQRIKAVLREEIDGFPEFPEDDSDEAALRDYDEEVNQCGEQLRDTVEGLL